MRLRPNLCTGRRPSGLAARLSTQRGIIATSSPMGRRDGQSVRSRLPVWATTSSCCRRWFRASLDSAAPRESVRRRRSAAPWRMSASLTSISSRPKARIDSSRIAAPATIVGRGRGGGPVTRRRSASGSAASMGRDALAGAAVEPVAVHPVRVVGVELEVDRGERWWRCRRRRCRARPARGPRPARRSAGSLRRRRRARPAPRASGGSLCEVALGVAHRSHARGDVEVGVAARPAHHVLGAAAADVDHEASASSSRPGGGAEKGEARLLVAGDGRGRRCRSARWISSRKAGPFSASRMALVATATTARRRGGRSPRGSSPASHRPGRWPRRRAGRSPRRPRRAA